MGLNLRLPNITGSSDREQLTQIKSYLYQMAEQLNFAMDKRLRDSTFPFSKLNGKDVNTLIFPNLSAANSAYKLLLEMGVNESVGPIQMGLNKPIHFTDIESSPRDIVNLTTVAVIDAIVDEKLHNK